MHDIRPYLPVLFNKPGTLLYVGARVDACSWLSELHECGHKIDVLEVWPENAHNLNGDKRIKKIIIGNAKDLKHGKWDVIFWWHGPEHLRRAEIAPTLDNLQKHTNLLVCACPWGLYPQGTHQGNPYEIHRTTLYPDDFLKWKFTIRTDGEPNQAGSEIVAWRWREN